MSNQNNSSATAQAPRAQEGGFKRRRDDFNAPRPPWPSPPHADFDRAQLLRLARSDYFDEHDVGDVDSFKPKFLVIHDGSAGVVARIVVLAEGCEGCNRWASSNRWASALPPNRSGRGSGGDRNRAGWHVGGCRGQVNGGRGGETWRDGSRGGEDRPCS